MRKTTLNLDIGKVIKERRALLGISQQDLSDYSGVGISTVKDLERGVGNPSKETLKKILDVVGLEIILQVKQTVK
jgi:transcriptional regulator with XRE-family HTH domain